MRSCSICDGLVSTNAPTVTLTYGFGDNELEMHKIVVHLDCVHDDDAVEMLLNEFHTAEDDS